MSHVRSINLYTFEYNESILSQSRSAPDYSNGKDEDYVSGSYWVSTSSISEGKWKSTNSSLVSKNGSEIWVRPDNIGEIKTLNSGDVTSEYVMEPVSGSLWHNILTNTIIKSKATVSGAASPTIYTTKSYPGFDDFVRNPAFWMTEVTGLTAISPWNSSGVGSFGQQGATAISPRHIISANHAPTGLVDVGWVATDNSLVTRSVVQQTQAAGTDIMVGILDSDLPANIEYLRLMADYTSLTSSLPALVTGSRRIVGCASNQTSRLGAIDITFSTSYTTFIQTGSIWVSASLGYPMGVGGDSGRPILVLIDNELILWSQFTGGTTGPSYPWSTTRAAVNSAMSALSLAQSAPIYTVETRSFDEFNQYG